MLQELLEPTGGVFCKGLGMLDTYLWSPPSSWADETDLPSDFFDLLTPSSVSCRCVCVCMYMSVHVCVCARACAGALREGQVQQIRQGRLNGPSAVQQAEGGAESLLCMQEDGCCASRRTAATMLACQFCTPSC